MKYTIYQISNRVTIIVIIIILFHKHDCQKM